MKRSGTRSLRRASPALALVALATAGCVTRGTYDEVARERDGLLAEKRRLEEQVDRLGASNEALGSERLALLDEMEDLRQQRTTLEEDVRKLKRTESLLSEHLRTRESELASRNEELARLHGTYERLVSDLESEVAAGQIEIEQLREGLRLNLPQDVLFPSGSARLNESGRAVLTKVAKRLRELPHRVEVQGHTDDVPIRPGAQGRFPSNWELAGARATEVVRLLAGGGVEPSRLTGVSFGEFAPVAPNDSAEGRAKNRRIEIRLHPTQEERAPTVAGEGAPAP